MSIKARWEPERGVYVLMGNPPLALVVAQVLKSAMPEARVEFGQPYLSKGPDGNLHPETEVHAHYPNGSHSTMRVREGDQKQAGFWSVFGNAIKTAIDVKAYYEEKPHG